MKSRKSSVVNSPGEESDSGTSEIDRLRREYELLFKHHESLKTAHHDCCWKLEELRKKSAAQASAIESLHSDRELHSERASGLASVTAADFSEIEEERCANAVQVLARYAAEVRPDAPKPVKALAFYLPQFHPIPENDEWWGKGFTEWTKVARARRLFSSHYQPQLPGELGYYDLRVPAVREAQAQLARDHGLYGFCYHYYWFNGRRLLDLPLREVLNSGRPDFPFCICWANEHWTRQWDGQPHRILCKQDHSLEDSERFIRSLLPALRDDRYVRVGGKAVLLVYRLDMFVEPAATAERWREIAYQEGVGELYLCSCNSFANGDPRPHGFDAAVEFPPHQIDFAKAETLPRSLAGDFEGIAYDARTVADVFSRRPDPDYRLLRSVAPAWDNTARVGLRARLWLHTSPQLYEAWLSVVAMLASARNSEEERLLFINAWNEWAEGCHLEPDERFGLRYLEATARVLSDPQLKSR